MEYFVNRRQFHNILRHNVHDLHAHVDPKVCRDEKSFDSEEISNIHNENLDMSALYNENRK